MADEVARAAQEAADEAHREAERLAAQAGDHAEEADEQLATTHELAHEVKLETARTVRTSRDNSDLDDLEERTRDQLLDLAAGLGIEGRSKMRKPQLVGAVKKATAAAR